MHLVPMTPEHLPLWHAWRAQPTARRKMPQGNDSLETLAKRLAAASTDLSDHAHTDFRWGVELDGQLIGTVMVRDVSWANGVAEIGYMLSEEVHGQGYGTRAVRMLVDLVFSSTPLVRLYAKTAGINVPSQRVLERIGFLREGVLRGHYVIQGERVDQVLYGLMRSEWRLGGKR